MTGTVLLAAFWLCLTRMSSPLEADLLTHMHHALAHVQVCLAVSFTIQVIKPGCTQTLKVFVGQRIAT